MLKRAGAAECGVIPQLSIRDAAFPAPFASGLEYSAPARGTWTIVHVGMLVPEAHEIFVCAAGCLRGVVLSAAEMNLTHRFSTIAIEEPNVLEGDMERLIIDGVTDILTRLPKQPPAVLLYTSCIHHFMGCDLELCYRVLRERFPKVDFTDCYMIPTMRKSGLTPDQIMRRQLYSLLRPRPRQNACAILGNCFSMDDSNDLVRLIRDAGFALHEITRCSTYNEYQQMAESRLYITTQPVAKAGGDALSERLGGTHLYLPFSYNSEEIRQNLTVLAEHLGIPYDGGSGPETAAEDALAQAKSVIGEMPIALDYTFTPRPLGLARLLLAHGLRVERIYTDSFSGEEQTDYDWLREQAPELTVLPTVHPGMRKTDRQNSGHFLALGQKAAYFTGSRHFVNLVEGGGLYGFDGIRKLAEQMIDACSEEQDTERLIQIKGLGCESCI